MDQNPKSQNKCEVCQQSFNSQRELQEHQKTAHGQQGQRQPGSIDDQKRDDQKREKIA